jgi:hypothetical protein
LSQRTESPETRPGLTAAHSLLARALSQEREILVITRQEIENLTETSQLINVLKRKRAQLAVSGTIYEEGRQPKNCRWFRASFINEISPTKR